MELGTIKQKVFLWSGWLSVIMGLTSLVILNIYLLSGYNVPIENHFSLFIITFIFGVASVFNNQSRSLGLWGVGLSLFLGFFVVVMFVLGWTINPFP